jgi:preprotein translocase subunit SecF
MNFLDKSSGLLQTFGKSVYDFFPKKLTFWSILFYFFFFYFIVYVGFSIYIYANGLEYEIDCESTTNCVKIKKRTDTKETMTTDGNQQQRRRPTTMTNNDNGKQQQQKIQ